MAFGCWMGIQLFVAMLYIYIHYNIFSLDPDVA